MTRVWTAGLLLAALLMPMQAAAETWGVVVRPVANMYSSPSADSDVVSQAIYASRVQVLEERGGWARINTADAYFGWMPIDCLLRVGGRPYASSGPVLAVESLFANLYREPSVTKHQPLLTVPFETRLEIASEPEQEDRRWIEVRLPDGRLAWIQRGDAALETQNLGIKETIHISKRFLGIPYLWGGTSSYGFDCSGFTQMLCRRRGIVIPRDAGPQARWEGMKAVERSQLEPGDLLYFGPSTEKINHTGMYIGSGEFIHATTNTRPMVQISLLDDEPWTKLMVAARRPK